MLPPNLCYPKHKYHKEVGITEKFIFYEKLSKKEKRKLGPEWPEPRHGILRKQRRLQSKQSPELEA